MKGKKIDCIVIILDKGPFKCYVTLFFGNWTPTHPLVTLITLKITPL